MTSPRHAGLLVFDSCKKLHNLKFYLYSSLELVSLTVGQEGTSSTRLVPGSKTPVSVLAVPSWFIYFKSSVLPNTWEAVNMQLLGFTLSTLLNPLSFIGMGYTSVRELQQVLLQCALWGQLWHTGTG